MKRILASTTAAFAVIAMTGAAAAQTAASATTDLNIRSGPGPQHEVVGVIGASEEATVHGCLEDSKWCKVSHDGTEGWSYSDYLAAEFDTIGAEAEAHAAAEAAADAEGTVVVLSQRPPEAVPVVRYEVTEAPQPSTTTTTTTVEGEDDDGEGGALAGTATGAIAGALIGGPVGAAIGGVAGAVTGGTVDQAIEPPERVVTYVRENRVEPVYLEGEVVTGAGLPETVQIREIPDYEYNYVYVNGQPVLVEPESRRIVYVVR